MRTERTGERIVVHLSQEEVFRAQDGDVVSDRPGVTLPDAKIHLWPLSAIQPDDSSRDKWSVDR